MPVTLSIYKCKCISLIHAFVFVPILYHLKQYSFDTISSVAVEVAHQVERDPEINSKFVHTTRIKNVISVHQAIFVKSIKVSDVICDFDICCLSFSQFIELQLDFSFKFNL